MNFAPSEGSFAGHRSCGCTCRTTNRAMTYPSYASYTLELDRPWINVTWRGPIKGLAERTRTRDPCIREINVSPLFAEKSKRRLLRASEVPGSAPGAGDATINATRRKAATWERGTGSHIVGAFRLV